jgi:hypothetical protein
VKLFTTCLSIGLAGLLIQPALAQIDETTVAANQALTTSTAIVPRLIRVNGTMPEEGKKQSTASVNFALYNEQNSSEPLQRAVGSHPKRGTSNRCF